MTNEMLKTLFHPFDVGYLPIPEESEKVLFLGAEPGFRLPDGWKAVTDLVQGFRPDYLALTRMGYSVAPVAEHHGYSAALILAGRHRGGNELQVAEALERVAPGGLILIAGSKENGLASLRKRLGGLVEVEDSLSKYHGIAVWFRRPANDEAMHALRAANPTALVEGRYHTAPGMFSFGHIDRGSRFLAENLPTDMHGTVADFCAGWGYLADEALRASSSIEHIDLYEADHAALEAARVNLKSAGERAGFYWCDLVNEAVAPRYDAIVMNPPFHQSNAAEPDLGRAMILKAAAALKRGGRLFLVANRGLPYEKEMAESFVRQGEIVRDSAFKILWGQKK